MTQEKLGKVKVKVVDRGDGNFDVTTEGFVPQQIAVRLSDPFGRELLEEFCNKFGQVDYFEKVFRGRRVWRIDLSLYLGALGAYQSNPTEFQKIVKISNKKLAQIFLIPYIGI